MSVVVENLVVRYGPLTAVEGASFTAPAGEVTAVLGPNGAGKTSTLEVCEGFRRLSGGSVRVLGLDPQRDHAALTRRMGVMLQGGGVYPSARVADVVGHHAALHGRRRAAGDLIERVGLGHRARSTWRRLSGGEQQRLSLALALAAEPEVAFLDEPTSGIDVEGRDIIRQVIAELASRGCTVVVASHELAEAERTADRVVLFRSGRVVVAGALEDILAARASTRFTSAAGLDTSALAAALGCPVDDSGAGSYTVAAPGTPALVAALSGWLAGHGHPLGTLDTGRETLEEAYRRLTGGTQ